MLLASKFAYVLYQRYLQVFSKDHLNLSSYFGSGLTQTMLDQWLAVMSTGFLLINRLEMTLLCGEDLRKMVFAPLCCLLVYFLLNLACSSLLIKARIWESYH